mmetsp:Transcript_24201/g.65567  ORF Transcript_24201/g.65567 Transcript_24201/m.65567 type:complete len:246 (-) Transcript_24201:6-743(-)
MGLRSTARAPVLPYSLSCAAVGHPEVTSATLAGHEVDRSSAMRVSPPSSSSRSTSQRIWSKVMHPLAVMSSSRTSSASPTLARPTATTPMPSRRAHASATNLASHPTTMADVCSASRLGTDGGAMRAEGFRRGCSLEVKPQVGVFAGRSSASTSSSPGDGRSGGGTYASLCAPGDTLSFEAEDTARAMGAAAAMRLEWVAVTAAAWKSPAAPALRRWRARALWCAREQRRVLGSLEGRRLPLGRG